MSNAPAMMNTYRRWPVRLVSGRGCTLVDDQGREYLDFTAGVAVASVGHCHPRVTRSIADQAAALVHVSNLYWTAPQADLADRLAGLAGGMQAFFCNSGAEAVEAALKLARKHGGPDRRRIVATDGSFHGRTLGALSVTGQPAKRTAFEPLVGEVAHVPFDDLNALEASLGPDVAAVLVEPIQGEAGVIVPSPGYLAGVEDLCRATGALMMVDEIQTGVGRTGAWFAYEHDRVSPDVVCLAKGLAAGLPIGACLAKPDVAAAFEPGDHGSTFGGGPVQCAAALSTIDVIENEGLLERATDSGQVFMRSLAGIFGDHRVRGRGLLIAVELPVAQARAVAEACLRLGLLVNDATPTVVRLTPPLVIERHEIDAGITILEKAWDEVSSA